MPTTIRLAQISDSHLFATTDALFHGVNVYQNLLAVLVKIASEDNIDAVVFTGDLTQDHSEKSYQQFANAVSESGLSKPVYYLAGNHDDPKLMVHYLAQPPFAHLKQFNLGNWQFFLANSKSATPAGFIAESELTRIAQEALPQKFQFIFCHHHPVDIGYFIDRHGLENQTQFWQTVANLPNFKGGACGHVHRGQELNIQPKVTEKATWYTCPATSIQFDPQAETVKALAQSAGYRLLTFGDNGDIASDVIRI